jgi:hypothetical protein
MNFGEFYDSHHFWELLRKSTLVSKWVRDMPREILGHTKFLLWSFLKCVAWGLLMSHKGCVEVGLVGEDHLKINLITCKSLLLDEGMLNLLWNTPYTTSLSG